MLYTDFFIGGYDKQINFSSRPKYDIEKINDDTENNVVVAGEGLSKISFKKNKSTKIKGGELVQPKNNIRFIL